MAPPGAAAPRLEPLPNRVATEKDSWKNRENTIAAMVHS